MTYVAEIRKLLNVCEVDSTIYEERKPVKVQAKVHPLTLAQRQQVERLSKERGYRRFVVDMVSM